MAGAARGGLLFRAILALLALPVNVTLTIPALLLVATRPVDAAFATGPAWLTALGAALLGLGLGLLVTTVRAFYRIGKGTLAPWAPPRHFVLAGPYRHIRHPMISGVVLILAGEAAVFAALALALWAAFFFAANALYLPLREEPALIRRFGTDYEAYRAHVPRWIPRLRPWRG